MLSDKKSKYLKNSNVQMNEIFFGIKIFAKIIH